MLETLWTRVGARQASLMKSQPSSATPCVSWPVPQEMNKWRIITYVAIPVCIGEWHPSRLRCVWGGPRGWLLGKGLPGAVGGWVMGKGRTRCRGGVAVPPSPPVCWGAAC